MEMDNFTLLNITNFTFLVNESILNIEDGDLNKPDKVITLALPVPEAAVSAILLSFLIIITLVGNVLVILSVFTYRPLRTVQNFFIVSLAIADLAVAALVMPFHVVVHLLNAWVFGIIFCEIWLTCDVLCCTASILNLSAIALDRYWAIHDPINYAQKRTLKRVMIMIALVWCISAVISIPPLIGWNDWKDELETKCELTAERGYIIYSSCGSFYIPLFIMTIVYIKIFLATRRRLRERARAAKAVYSQNKGTKTVERTSSDTPSEQDEASTDNVKSHHTHIKPNNSTASHSEYSETNRLNPDTPKKTHVQVHQFLEEKQKISLSKERRAARTLGIIMGVFVLCWLPFFLLYVIVPFCNCGKPDDRLANFILWLGYVNSALNPIIYTIFNIDFRRAFARLLGAKCRN